MRTFGNRPSGVFLGRLREKATTGEELSSANSLFSLSMGKKTALEKPYAKITQRPDDVIQYYCLSNDPMRQA